MIAKLSPLKLENLVITNLKYSFVHPQIEFSTETFAKYVFDVDYALVNPESNIFEVYFKALINHAETPLPGYQIEAESVGIFSIDEGTSEDDKKNLLNTSAMVMTVNYMRTFLAGVSSHFPFGKYWLPSIDLKDLHEKKLHALSEAKEKGNVTEAGKD